MSIDFGSLITLQLALWAYLGGLTMMASIPFTADTIERWEKNVFSRAQEVVESTKVKCSMSFFSPFVVAQAIYNVSRTFCLTVINVNVRFHESVDGRTIAGAMRDKKHCYASDSIRSNRFIELARLDGQIRDFRSMISFVACVSLLHGLLCATRLLPLNDRVSSSSTVLDPFSLSVITVAYFVCKIKIFMCSKTVLEFLLPQSVSSEEKLSVVSS